MTLIKRTILITVMWMALFACQNDSKKSKKQIESQKEITIAYIKNPLDSKSELELTIPNYLQIIETTKDSYTVYSLCPMDTTNKNYTNGGLYFSRNPLKTMPLYELKVTKDSIINGMLLGKSIQWHIYEYSANGLISGETISEVGDSLKIHVYVYAESYPQLDTLLNTMQSLKKSSPTAYNMQFCENRASALH